MKKIYLLAGIILSSFSLFAQTATHLKCYGWGDDLEGIELPEAITMAGYDQEAIDAEDAVNDVQKSSPWRFGYKYSTNINFENSGQWLMVEGGRLWRIKIECPGAMTVNLLLDNFYLPEGATLFLYDVNRTNKIGAYTSKNNRVEKELGTEMIHGDGIVVEYFEPNAALGQGTFNISHVIHGYRSLSRIQKDLEKGLNDSGACNIDVNCPLGDSWDAQIRSVAMIVVSGDGICSGALINNTCDDARMLFLTANHCLGGSTANWAFRFNWESPEGTEVCAAFTPSVDPGSPYDQTANGATVLDNAGISDYALLEIDNMTLTQAIAWNCFFAGWDNSDAETVTEATGIHHPSGDLKKICREDNDPYHDAAGGAQVWWINNWDQGVTEPGSSGSPLFDQNKRIIGQLYGGAAACSGVVDNGQYDFYGRFGVSWDNGASAFLAPPGCGAATILNDGYQPGEACDGTLSIVKQNTLCNGSADGEIVVNVTGGVSPFTYNIGDGPVASNVFEGLSSGTYTVTVVDGDDCVSEISAVISSPSAMVVTSTSEFEIAGEDGSINLSVSGGTPVYTYSWTGPGGFTAATQDISGLVAGLYDVLVTDNNDCVKFKNNIEVESALSISEENFGIRIYPNPSKGYFYIFNEGVEILSISLYDLSGREINLNEIANNLDGINLSQQADGTYLALIVTEQGSFYQKLVKKN